MPVVGSVLTNLIQTNVDSRMGAIAGHHPLQQKTPLFYIEMCQAIGNGIAMGGPSVSFTSSDVGFTGAPPVPGVGAGVGIVTDPTFFIEDLYTRVRNYVIDDFGRTMHDPYPPTPGNSGEYLQALCQGINDSFISYYTTAWILTSVDPLIYAGTGTINNGDFTGLVAPTIQTQIISGAPNFLGRFWPRLAQAISESYVALIEQHSTGTLTISGVCVPSLVQVCSLPGTGIGTGTAA
jgi:hypothetical protein